MTSFNLSSISPSPTRERKHGLAFPLPNSVTLDKWHISAMDDTEVVPGHGCCKEKSCKLLRMSRLAIASTQWMPAAAIMVLAQRDSPQVLSAPGKQPPVPVRHWSCELPFWKGRSTVVAGLFETAGPPPGLFSAQYVRARLIAHVVWGYPVRCQETCEFLTTRHTPVRD